jgi:fucose 4-O-acetylase-like acetyltransferase
VAANTPVARDRAIDVIRIVSLVAVVLGHTIMAVSTIRNGVLIWDNLLSSSIVLQALTWVFQIMPLFFFAGAAACVDSWKPSSSWGGWLMQRCTRLYRPVFFYLAFWAVTLPALRMLLPPHVYDPVAGISIQLLWFLGAYVLVLAAAPLLSRITSTGRLAAAVAGVYALVAAVDAARLNMGGLTGPGYLNLVVWVIPAMFGVAYRRGLVSVPVAAVTAATLLIVDLALVALGPYEVSLVGVEGLRLSNVAPPSLLQAGHTIVLSALAIAAAPAIARWARRPRVWWPVAIGNSGAMTLYLWHIPALLGIHLIFDALGLPRYDPAAPAFVLLSVVQIVLMVVLVSVLFVVLRPLENNPLPGWDGGDVVAPGIRSAAVGTLLCLAAAATLASVPWGLKDHGLVCAAVLLAALITARLLATGSGASLRFGDEPPPRGRLDRRRSRTGSDD